MTYRYKIRAFESGEQDGIVANGTVVMPIERTFSVFARAIDEAERNLQAEVAAGRLATGRVYQICPPFGNPESIRSFTVSADGAFRRTYLDSATGVYSESKRIRHQDMRKNLQREEVLILQQA